MSGPVRVPRYLSYRFPWRAGNRVELLYDGDRFYARMLAAIEAARRYVLLEIYLFESGVVATRFIDVLVAAARRGITVRLVLDDFGAHNLGDADRERLAGGGVEVVYYNRLRYGKLFANLARDHRKILIVDGEVAFAGGAGITDEFDPPAHPERRWRELVVETRGPVVADWQTLFVGLWNREHAPPLDLTRPDLPPNPQGMAGRVTVIEGPRRRDTQRALQSRIRYAGRRVWIMTAYFVPSGRLKRALKRAASRGLDVRLLLPGPITDHPGVRHAGRRFYGQLLAAGVRIYEYQPRFLHAKAALVDDWVSVGSSNYDRWNLRWNLEANQEVEDRGFAATVAAMFESDLREAMECRHENWQYRPWYARLREWFWGRVDLFLHRLGRGREHQD